MKSSKIVVLVASLLLSVISLNANAFGKTVFCYLHFTAGKSSGSSCIIPVGGYSPLSSKADSNPSKNVSGAQGRKYNVGARVVIIGFPTGVTTCTFVPLGLAPMYMPNIYGEPQNRVAAAVGSNALNTANAMVVTAIGGGFFPNSVVASVAASYPTAVQLVC